MSGGFERVKQEEREDIYCNGAQHVCLYGDQFGHSPSLRARHDNVPAAIRTGRCDCPRPSQPEKVPA